MNVWFFRDSFFFSQFYLFKKYVSSIAISTSDVQKNKSRADWSFEE